MSDNSSALSYRERVVRYYQAYAPEGLSKVDSAMERYAGQEERLLNDLKTKYGKAEPTDEQVRIGLASPPAPMPSTELSSSPSIRRTGSTAGPPRRPSMAGSPRSRQGSVGSPNQGNSSFAASPSGVVAASSPPPPASSSQQSGTFGDVQVSDGDDDDPFGTPLAESQRRPVDPYTSMRSKVTHDVGFSDVIFKRIWEDAWMGKIPYGNLYKTWGDSIIHSGFGWKLTNASAIQRWQKRYFVLVPHFLYYFDSDDAKAPCKGAVYLERATIKEQDIKERKGIVITPRVHKKPLELVSEGDFSNFTINFDPKKAQDVWVELLNNMAKIVPTPTQPAGTSSLDSATPTRGGIPDSPGVALKKVQSSVGSASLARRAAPTVSPMRLERNSTAGVSGGGGYGAVGGDQQSSLFSPVGAVGAPHNMTLAQFPPTSNSLDRNTSYPLTPREAAILAAADAHGAQLPPMPIVRPNAFLAALEDPSVLNNSAPPLAQESNAANSNAVGVNMATIAATGASSSAAAATTTVSEHHNRQLLQQQQKLQQMLVAAQQQQSDLLFRSQLQQEVTKARQTLHVDESDLKRRIGRIADDRDTPALAEALLSFVIDNVSDLNALWKLMSQLDDLPRKKTNTPASSPVPPQQQEFGGDGYYAAQQQQQQPNLVGLTPRASPPPQQYGSSSVGGGASISQYPHTPHVAYQQQQPVLHRHHTPNLDDDIVSVSRVSAAQPTTTLTYDHISHQIAADQAHYRETEAALYRQRILENQEIAARYQQQQQQQMDHAFSNSGGHHHVPGGPSSLFATTAAAGLPTASHGGHLYSPSASSWPIAHRAGSLGAAYPPSAGNLSVGQRQGAEDYAWQERLARMKQRKRAVEGLLNDLPA